MDGAFIFKRALELALFTMVIIQRISFIASCYDFISLKIVTLFLFVIQIVPTSVVLSQMYSHLYTEYTGKNSTRRPAGSMSNLFPHLFTDHMSIFAEILPFSLCSSCRDTIKAIYGSHSEELRNFNNSIRCSSS